MDRRKFVAGTFFAGIQFFAIGELQPVEAEEKSQSIVVNKVQAAQFGFSKKYNQLSLRKALPTTSTSAEESAASNAPQPPLAFLYYDTNKKKFLSAKDVAPTLSDKTKKYKLDAALQSFGVSTQSTKSLQKIKGNLQLGVNIGAPTANDTLSWVFMSAVDVFLQKGDNSRKQALAKFENYSPTASLKSQNQIVIPGDTVNIQVSAYGQPKQSFWADLFHTANVVAGSPLVGVLALPNLVSESLSFVDSVFSQISQKNQLLTIWETMPAQFGIFKDTTEYYRFAPGYWTLVDLEYAKRTNGLENHSLEMDFGSFQLLTGPQSSSPSADANYLVVRFQLQPQS